MGKFNYIARDYTPTVDLSTVGKTFDTLEQGHKEAIKTAGELNTAIAQLDMNEAEDGFKQQLVNGIKQTIAENSRYGNAAGALDNLIMQSGNIASNPAVIGRLRAQQDYKKFQDSVDKAKIPDGMKEMYKELNPYHYEDKVDNNGNIIGGSKWEASKKPVDSIDLLALMRAAKDIAAAEKGSGESITFLDANGRETSDPMQSADGAFYRKTHSSYERLPKDKIMRAIKMAIKSTPGAEDSLRQDYEYDIYKRDKLLSNREKYDDVAPYIAGLTDINGNVYDYETYLNNKFTDFADVAKYNYVNSSTDFGNALQNRLQASGRGIYGGGSGNGDGETFNPFNTTTGVGNMTFAMEEDVYDTFGNTINNKNKAKSAIDKMLSTINDRPFKGKTYSFNGLIQAAKDIKLIDAKGNYGPGRLTNAIIGKYGQNWTPQEKALFRTNMMGYWSASRDYYKYIDNATPQAKDAMKFNSNMSNEVWTNDNAYGKLIIYGLNKAKQFGNITYEIGDDVYQKLKTKYSEQEMTNNGFIFNINEDGEHQITIPTKFINFLPKFDNAVREADGEVNGNLISWLKKSIGNVTSKGNFTIIGGGRLTSANDKGYSTLNQTLRDLNINYKTGQEKAANIQAKYITKKGTSTMSSTDYGTKEAMYWWTEGLKNGLTPSEVKTRADEANKRAKNAFGQPGTQLGELYTVEYAGDNQGNAKKVLTNKLQIGELLQYMCRTHPDQVSMNYSTGKGITKDDNSEGYVFSFTVPTNIKDMFPDNDFYDDNKGKTITVISKGAYKEGINYMPQNNKRLMASHAVQIAESTNGDIDNLGYNRTLGDTKIRQNRNGFTSIVFGHSLNLNKEQAIDLSEAYNTLSEFKSMLQPDSQGIPYLRHQFRSDAEFALGTEAAYNQLIQKFVTATGLSEVTVKRNIQNYLSDNDYAGL